MKTVLTLLFWSAAILTCAQPKPIGACEDCELMMEGMPASLSWEISLASDQEPGERLHISGIIYKADGKTPAAGIILYVYQTDHQGLYSKGHDQIHGIRHGHLRGWMKTDANGRYAFSTIRPASYPNSNNPQHIHPIIYEKSKGYYWIDEFQFEDDPLLTAKVKSSLENRGGSGVLKLKKSAKGWEGKRNIVLGWNVPGY